MRHPRWLHRDALLLLHAEVLAEHGGLSGLRDEAALDAALARPQHVLAYQPTADAAGLAAAFAAAYGFGIVRDHPFNDGNKRVGFLAIGLFLTLNGFALVADQVEAVQTIVQLAAGRLTEQRLAEWIRSHTMRHG